ncbi:uncharacterized protein LOC108281598 [Cebus imitator]|uniref:uncharacterized protein LOC108281598 n=1 Tax=Cebus imitator TaxID=2715852 RepID=UPI000809EF76|nr:uncharacterized protein LOC108281598 [Cebus imitator]
MLLLELQLQHPLVSGPQEGEGKEPGLSRGGQRSHFCPPTATSVLTAHVSPESRGRIGLGIRNAGYFHPDVLCHHRPGHSVLHYLSALVAWSCGGRSLLENSSEGGMELNGRAPCLLTHRWIFASGCYLGSWSPVQQEASHPQQRSRCPADLFQSLPDMADPWHARGFLS